VETSANENERGSDHIARRESSLEQEMIKYAESASLEKESEKKSKVSKGKEAGPVAGGSSAEASTVQTPVSLQKKLAAIMAQAEERLTAAKAFG